MKLNDFYYLPSFISFMIFMLDINEKASYSSVFFFSLLLGKLELVLVTMELVDSSVNIIHYWTQIQVNF